MRQPVPYHGRWVQLTRAFQRALLEATLEETGGNRSQTAIRLGITRSCVTQWIRRWGTRVPAAIPPRRAKRHFGTEVRA